MKAVTTNRYGAPEKVLEVTTLKKPTPGKEEILIQVCATAINDVDWAIARGKPLLYRLLFGITRPKYRVPGMELSGKVAGTGALVKKWKIGDEVYGDISAHGFGSFAEYVCIHENAVKAKPANINFELASALPHAALLALQGLRDLGGLRKDMAVLINGAGGGVGTFALQLAKLQGCTVTGVDHGEKLEMMKALGFDHVVDYTAMNFTRNGLQYDLILDCKTSQPAFSYLKSLRPHGRYITVGGRISALLGIFFIGQLVRLISTKRLQVLSLKSNEGLEEIGDLAGKGLLRGVIDGPYTLAEVPRLVQYFGEGRHKGKIVVKL
jgi:NADPH:quinone reductase-like Zn-dependent oxidoreductase